MMNEALDLEIGQKVLEVGAGSGWHASTVAEIVAPSNKPKKLWGHVYTVEIIPELASFARRNIERAGYGERVTVIYGDGSTGYPKEAPYDRILVTAAAPSLPEPIIEQLRIGGKVVIPIGSLTFFQRLKRFTKVDGKVLEENLTDVAFVPLVGKYGHKI
ncbi:MAG: protein-L-isoaspartate O-methyltransferase [Candidatus Bathyarchaeia archaeon]